MNNRSFQKAINLVFTLALTFGLLLPASTTLAAGVSTPNDPKYSSPAPGQWNLKDTYGINAPAAWAVTNGSASTIVAVIDSGINKGPTSHVDLGLNEPRILSGWDFVSDIHRANDSTPGRDGDPGDPGDWLDADDLATGFFTDCIETPNGFSTWHGMHVAGIIGAKSNNGTGVAGINWETKILPVRVTGKCGTGGTPTARGIVATDIIDGMSWAAGLVVSGTTQRTKAGDPDNYPANVLNVGVGVSGVACTSYQARITEIINTGAVIVAAAGDGVIEGANTSYFPANCTGVITVAATDNSGNLALTSNFDSTVEISAPGEDVLSTTDTGEGGPVGDTYTTKTDTGVAAAHVSGVVSLMLSTNPAMTPTYILQTLQKTAKAFPTTGGPTCNTDICGSGIVDAGAALKSDLIITNVFLKGLVSGDCPDNATQPSTAYSPPPDTAFCVYITIKNQGGPGNNANVSRNVYVDRDPSTLGVEVDPANSVYGSLFDLVTGENDVGDCKRTDFSPSIPAGEVSTLGVKISTGASCPNFSTDGLSSGPHTLYAYADANGTVNEVNENNNNKLPPITISVGTSTNGGDTIGVFRRSNATFYLRNSNTAGAPDITKKLGATTDYPVVGDWDGNGTDTIGLYRNGVFYLSNSNTTGQIDLTFAFGKAGDQPIAGDWDGDGIDTIGIYRSLKITFLLRNTNSAGPVDATFKLGIPGDVGIAGDWNADGMDSTGVFRPSNGALYFKNANTTGYADIVTVYGIKNDKPVVGDWDGDGDATIGIYRSNLFFLRNTNTRGYADFEVLFGAVGDMPLSGNWDGVP
jgi:serine protease